MDRCAIKIEWLLYYNEGRFINIPSELEIFLKSELMEIAKNQLLYNKYYTVKVEIESD